MTYLELINDFWREFENQALKPNDALLYLFLLRECNRLGWQNPFPLSTKKIGLYLEMSNKGIAESRNRLAQRDLIQVQNGERRTTSPLYFLPRVLVSHGNQKRNQNGNQKRNQNGNQKETKTGTII